MDPCTLFKVIQKTGQRSESACTFLNPARAEASGLLGILQIIDCCGRSFAVLCSSLIRLFVLLSGQTKQNILQMIQRVVGEDRGLLSHRHHLFQVFTLEEANVKQQADLDIQDYSPHSRT